MPRLPLLASTVLMSLGLMPGACFAQQGFPYGPSLPAQPTVTNVPVVTPGLGNQASLPRTKTIVISSPTVGNLTPKPLVAGTVQTRQFVATVNSPQTNGSSTTKGLLPASNPPSAQQTTPLPSVKQPSRVTDPMLQNMSNPSNLSFEGLATGQQVAPNTYFGRQFDNWGNTRDATTMMPASFGGLSPTPPQPFGIYFEPNTYVGTGYSNWSNMSLGVVATNPLGGWNYSTR